MPAPTTVPTPTIAPTVTPDAAPWHERFTDPARICPQQRREHASPDVMP